MTDYGSSNWILIPCNRHFPSASYICKRLLNPASKTIIITRPLPVTFCNIGLFLHTGQCFEAKVYNNAMFSLSEANASCHYMECKLQELKFRCTNSSWPPVSVVVRAIPFMPLYYLLYAWNIFGLNYSFWTQCKCTWQSFVGKYCKMAVILYARTQEEYVNISIRMERPIPFTPLNIHYVSNPVHPETITNRSNMYGYK